MKKVVSALTAAAMCASMAAGVMSVFAAYTPEEIAFSLEVVSTGDYTVDGNTITFASAEAAKNATFTVAQYIEADPSKVDIQQVGGRVQASDFSVVLADTAASLTDSAYNDTAVEYTLSDGTTFSTKMFVNCFGWLNARGAYKHGTSMFAVTDESTFSFDYDGTSQLSWIWMYSFDANIYDDYKTTAHFLGATSDEYPLTQFDVTLGADITDGEYSIDFVETFDTHDAVLGVQDATFVTSGAGDNITPTFKNLKIVVGDASVEPDTQAPTDAPTDVPTDAPTDVEEPTDPPVSTDEYAWVIGDVTADPGEEVPVYITVQNDEGCAGFIFQVLIDGKSIGETDFTCSEIAQGDIDYNVETYADFGLFVGNAEELMASGANNTAVSDSVAVAGSPVVTMWITVPADAEPGTVYELSFNDAETAISDIDGVKRTPSLVSGSITVNGEVEPTDAVEPTTEAPTDEPTTEAPTDEPTTEAPTVPVDPDYLYGDVNENGVVELVDIVALNRALVEYDGVTKDSLNDYQKEVANCYYDGALDGKDSMEILRYLIGNVASLPTAAQ